MSQHDSRQLMQVNHEELHELLADTGSVQSTLVWGPPGVGQPAGNDRCGGGTATKFTVYEGGCCI